MIVPARSPRPTRKGPGRAPVRGGKAKEGDFTDRRHVSAELRICGWRLNFGAYSLELCELAEVSAKAVARHCNPSRLS